MDDVVLRLLIVSLLPRQVLQTGVPQITEYEMAKERNLKYSTEVLGQKSPCICGTH